MVRERWLLQWIFRNSQSSQLSTKRITVTFLFILYQQFSTSSRASYMEQHPSHTGVNWKLEWVPWLTLLHRWLWGRNWNEKGGWDNSRMKWGMEGEEWANKIRNFSKMNQLSWINLHQLMLKLEVFIIPFVTYPKITMRLVTLMDEDDNTPTPLW